jgi:hypothetical protein
LQDDPEFGDSAKAWEACSKNSHTPELAAVHRFEEALSWKTNGK